MTRNHRIRRRAVLTSLAAAAVAPTTLRAQPAYPSRPVRLVVPFPPGGSNDLLSRMIAERLAVRLGQPVVVDNRGGAGGTIGTDFVAKAAPDGHTLLFASGSITTQAAAGKKLPYDLLRDLEPVGTVASGPYVVVVARDLKARNLREFLELARVRPHGLNYGSAGSGGFNHLGTELLASAAGVQLVHVPYKGIAPAFTDLMAGTLQMALPSFASMIPHLRSDKMRSLAITSAKRSPLAPDLPTVAEAGLPGFRLEVWWGLLAPARTPAPIIKRLNEELNAVLAMADVRDFLAREGATPEPATPEAFRAVIREEVARWTRLIRDANITID